MTDTQKIYVVDDDEGIRKSLKYLIESEGLTVLTYESAISFLDQVPPTATGCIVADIRMPGMSGMELQKRLIDDGCEMPLILITGFGDVPNAVEAMRLGAVDYIEKPVEGDVIIERVQTALALDRERRAAQALVDAVKERIDRLTRREREIVDLVFTGQSSREIADALGLKQKTIETHRMNIMRKMEADGVPHLIHMLHLVFDGDQPEQK